MLDVVEVLVPTRLALALQEVGEADDWERNLSIGADDLAHAPPPRAPKRPPAKYEIARCALPPPVLPTRMTELPSVTRSGESHEPIVVSLRW